MDDEGRGEEIPQIGNPIGRIGSDLLKASGITGEVRTEPLREWVDKGEQVLTRTLCRGNFVILRSRYGLCHSDVPIIGALNS